MNEITLYDKLDPLDAIDRMGEFFAKSGMFGCERVEQGKVLAAVCMAEKKSPIQVLRENHLIDGKLSQRADYMLASFRQRGGKHRVIERSPDRAAVELELDGEKQAFVLTFADACLEPHPWSNKRGPDGKTLLKTNWATPRARMQMLWARVISDGVRTMCPEVVAGIYTPEEIADERDARPAPTINLQAPPPQSAPPEKHVTPPDTDAELAAAGLAPSVPPAPVQSAPSPAPSPGAAPTPTEQAAPGNGGIDTATILAVGKAVAGIEAEAQAWLIANGKLTPEQGVADLDPKFAARILKWPDKFRASVERWHESQKGKQ